MAEIIEMSRKAVRQLVADEGDEMFELVGADVDMLHFYKGYAPAEWIFKRVSDGTCWRADGEAGVGGWQAGKNCYDENLTRVERVEEVIVHKFWKAV